MFLMFALGAVVIVAGFSFDQADFAAALMEREGRAVPAPPDAPFEWSTFLAAAALLFSSFIGFDSIAQGAAKRRTLAATSPWRSGSPFSRWEPSTCCSRRPSTTPSRGASSPPRRRSAT